jgi:trk system potassium uptake protein
VRGLPESDASPEDREQALRSAQVIIAHHDTVIQANDHVIVFLPRKRMVREVEKLLQVSATFF